uniref:receptor protein-tyrosine kinase n=1 Tax=Astyanax mexicanus TaxID=7994 RepID=A0A8B9KY23_ASTMX
MWWSQPMIKVNSEDLHGSDVIVPSNSRLVLRCEGDAPVTWIPRLSKHKRNIQCSENSCTLSVDKATYSFTGTYRCAYQNTSVSSFSSVHIFVRDPNVLFVTPSSTRSIVMKEGEDVLLPCLLTDPAATNIQLRMDNGTAPPPGMNITFDPKKGMLIRNAHPGYNADYVCRGRIRGVTKQSAIFSINIVQRARFPPYVFLKSTEYVRIVGEKLEISCSTHNPNFNYNVTWKHSSRAVNTFHFHPHWSDVKPLPHVSLDNIFSQYDLENTDIRFRLRLIQFKNIVHVKHVCCISPYRYEAVLLLSRLNSREQGRYTFYANSSKANASVTFSVQMFQLPVVELRQTNSSSVTCTSFGYPAPQITWYQCQGNRPTCTDNSTLSPAKPIPAETVEVEREEFGVVEVESVLSITPSDQKMTVECIAVNRAGKDIKFLAIEKLFTSSLVGATCVMAFLLLLLIILLYKYKQKPRYEIRWKIIEATDGNNYTFIDPTQLPYSEKWEFPRDKLKLGKILGAGAFGKVVEATAYGLGKGENVTRVAVKMLKASAHSDEKEALMSELKILSHIGHHKNIVNLLGACTYGGPVLVITEYCCHGDLLNFLRTKAETFLNYVMTVPGITEERSVYKNITADRMFIRSDSGISSTCSDTYLDMRPVGPRSKSTRDSSCEGQEEHDSWPLDMDDLLRFSYQVAQGLDFLAAKNCIHRDVAARNVLLTDGRIAKICDFGLARDIMNDSNYVVKGNARLPVKWMAPESIFECVYTVQSDVWSYGILLWEIFSLGKSPYPNMLVDSKFYQKIKSGYQMSRPDFAPPEMYTIMQMCWNLEPTERPTFGKIAQLIERLLGDTPEEYQNVQSGVLDEQQLEVCDPEKTNEESCEQEEEEQPLMKPNNYQFC